MRQLKIAGVIVLCIILVLFVAIWWMRRSNRRQERDYIDHPLMGIFNHWVIWNIPPQESIAQETGHGAVISGGALEGAIQG